MTLLELMERTGIREPKRIMLYVKDAVNEIQGLIPEYTSGQKINVVADTRTYDLPSNMVDLIGVYRRWDTNDRYIKIPEIQNITVITSTS